MKIHALRRGLADHVGLAKPYKFERTLVALVALTVGVVVGTSGLIMYANGDVTYGTPRAWYFLYVTILLAASLLLARWPRLATALLALATLEAGFGLGSAVLQKYQISARTLFPEDHSFGTDFTWHALLQAVPSPSLPRGSASAKVHHNANGLRGRERSPEQFVGKTVVALFGGSTTYDIGSPDGETWPERLEALLGADRYVVLNHGVPGYTTAENVIQTAFYEQPHGARPRCAVYYVGWNDLKNSHIRGLDPGYADFHMPMQIDALQARRIGGATLSISPTLSILGRLLVVAFDTVRPATQPDGELHGGPDPALESIYLRNIRSISAINRQRGVTTIWIGQVMDPDKLMQGLPAGWMPFLPPKEIWPLIERLNMLVKREAQALGDVHADIPASAFTSGDFRDVGHFGASGSFKFSTLLAPIVATACTPLP